MKQARTKHTPAATFETVSAVGLALPGVEAATKYDGSPLLKVGGSFMAGLAMHPSAEPETLVVRADLEEREALLEEAPETYYLTDYYRNHPVVLARLARLDRDSLRDLLSVSRRLTLAKRRKDGTAKEKFMGMFDGLLGGIVGAGMVTVVNGIIEKHGGLQGVVSEFERNGLGATVRSWVGTGPNQPISPAEVQRALGPELLQQLSAKSGMSVQDLTAKLAQVLPQAVDNLTPTGAIPKN